MNTGSTENYVSQTFYLQCYSHNDLDIDELLIPAMIIQPFAENSY